MVNPSSDSYRNPLRYQGQDYSFAPIYRRERDPNSPTDASSDIKPKEQQGYYPISSLWSNSTNGNLWALANIYYSGTATVANWILIGSASDNPILNVEGDDAVEVDPDAGGTLTINGVVVANATHAKAVYAQTGGASIENIEVQVGAAIAATDITKVGLASFDNTQFAVDADGFVTVKNGDPLVTLSDNAGTLVTPTVAGNIQLEGQLNEQTGSFATTVSGTNLIKINPMSPARWIVDPLSTTPNPNGTHTTIQGALDSASAGDTIIVMPGTYNETLTLKNACNLVGFDDDVAGIVNITGTLTLDNTATGAFFTISGIRFTASAGSCITHSGTEVRQLFLTRCRINVSGTATGITFTNTALNSAVDLNYCAGDASDAGSKIFAVSGTDSNSSRISFNSSYFSNGGATTVPSATANTNSSGFVVFNNSRFRLPVTISGDANFQAFSTDFTNITGTTLGNLTNLTIGGNGINNKVTGCVLSSGNQSAAVITGTVLMTSTTITSSNANVLDGAGTINYGGLVFVSGTNNNVTTKNLLTVT